MIDLFSIKLNGTYDEIGAVPTISEGLFLCDTTSENFVRGYTYKITTNSTHIDAERVDAVTDYKIEKAIYPTITNVCEWLNNWFTLKYNYNNQFAYGNYGLTGAFHEVATLPKNGDLCKIRYTDNWDMVSAYSFYFVSYVSINEQGVISADNPQFESGHTYFYYPMHLPDAVEKAISDLIYYDYYTRGVADDIKSENIGNYSYTKHDVTIGTLAYPYELIAGIDTSYRKMRFVQ